MVDESVITAALVELDGIANAPMTAEQRLTRAKPVLAAPGLTLGDLTDAIVSPALPWNAGKAAEHSLTQEQWQEAITLSGVAGSADLGAFMDLLHRAESAANMLRAGYAGKRSASGEIAWSR
ncbi:MAG TPA: hypothetical protein VMT90_00390 [Dehalococcoidia bacterium]|nr:hypothetical protein [Dehalococcoidia bacterium]